MLYVPVRRQTGPRIPGLNRRSSERPPEQRRVERVCWDAPSTVAVTSSPSKGPTENSPTDPYVSADRSPSREENVLTEI
jgi:hypothetical protein